MAFRLVRMLALTLLTVSAVVLVGGGVFYAYDQTKLAAQARATPQVPPEAAAVHEDSVALDLPPGVNVATAHLLYGRDDVVILDVRSQAEYDPRHLPGAALIPLDELQARLEEVPRNGTVIVACRTGRRSLQAVQTLRSEGFDNVHNLIGGIRAWDKAGFEVEP